MFSDKYTELKRLDAGTQDNIGHAFRGILMQMNTTQQLGQFLNWLNNQVNLSPSVRDKVFQIAKELDVISTDEAPALVVGSINK